MKYPTTLSLPRIMCARTGAGKWSSFGLSDSRMICARTFDVMSAPDRESVIRTSAPSFIRVRIPSSVVCALFVVS